MEIDRNATFAAIVTLSLKRMELEKQVLALVHEHTNIFRSLWQVDAHNDYERRVARLLEIREEYRSLTQEQENVFQEMRALEKQL